MKTARSGIIFSREDIQWFPDSLNLPGKSKKVQVLGSAKQLTENRRKRDGKEMQVSYTLHFNSSRDIMFFCKRI